MSIRSALKWLNDTFRPPHVAHEHEGPDKDAALGAATMANHNPTAIVGAGPVDYPPNYTPSQQDERPH